MHIDPASLDATAIAGYAKAAHDQSVVGFLTHIIPSTVFGAFTEGDILQVLFISVLFAFALQLMGDLGKPLLNIIDLIANAFFRMLKIVMYVAPLGAFGGMAFTVGKYGVGSLVSYGNLLICYYVTPIFIAQALDIDVSLYHQVTLLLILLLTSKGAASVTGGAFITLAATLGSMDVIPAAGLVLVLGVYRFISEGGALINVIGNGVATIFIARWDGALDREQLQRELG
ncbi:C4-dicarboxylate transport protein [Pseudomonas fluorescens]|uniref:C4-dicarboxylate transport protein n=1 Tax=Pseudomonas fluorescens TaxID=294 RepID=A0A5E7UGE9_PSEFL|nr:C4-dicarboxylate transport protein [Pseudomonas fluorescens]VVQ09760.1 C4-dicarboxylate transport protein [Pseudomonas fluorescens]